MVGVSFQKCCLVGLLVVAIWALVILQSGGYQIDLFGQSPARRPQIAKAVKGPQVQDGEMANIRQGTVTREYTHVPNVEQRREQARENEQFLNPGENTLYPNLQQIDETSDRRTESKPSAVPHNSVKGPQIEDSEMANMRQKTDTRENTEFQHVEQNRELGRENEKFLNPDEITPYPNLQQIDESSDRRTDSISPAVTHIALDQPGLLAQASALTGIARAIPRQNNDTRENTDVLKAEQELPRRNETFLNLGMNSDFQQFNGNSDRRSQRKSSAVTHIAYAKIHKASSTTMMNVLMRFGIRRNLTFVLSTKDKPIPVFHYSEPGPLPIMPIPRGHHYDIIFMHCKFNSKVYSHVMPTDTVYIGSIREPVSAFVSAVYYFQNDTYMESLMSGIRKHDLDFLRYKVFVEPDLPKLRLFSVVRNHQARDFGFNTEHLLDTNQFDEYLNFLDKKFTLVLLTERFDESLVLLKRYLNWDMEDIVYSATNLNAGQKPRRFQLLDSDTELILAYNYLDVKVHDFFANRLDRQIAQEGSDFADEFSFFKSVLERISSFCGEDTSGNTRSVEIAASRWNETPFTVDCGYLQIDGTKFYQSLYTRHNLMFPPESIKESDLIINSMVN